MPPDNVATRRDSSIIELSWVEHLYNINVSLTDCAVDLVVVVDNNPTTTNPFFNDSIPSIQAVGILVSNASNVAIVIGNCTFNGGIFRRAVSEPYVTLGCIHVATVACLFGVVVHHLDLSVATVKVNFSDNASYTPPDVASSALLSGIGSVSVTVGLLSLAVPLDGAHNTITIADVEQWYDVTFINYFTSPLRGGVNVAGIVVGLITYFPRIRGSVPLLMASMSQDLGEPSQLHWNSVHCLIVRSSFTFAALTRASVAAHIFSLPRESATTVLGVCSGLYTGGVKVSGLRLSVEHNLFTQVGVDALPSSHSNNIPLYGAQFWLHFQGDVAEDVVLTFLNIQIVPHDPASTLQPTIAFVNASLALSTVSL